MEREGHVRDHGEQVEHGQPGQDAVDGGAHVLAREHGDVQHVHRNPERADDEADDAVQGGVGVTQHVEGRHLLLRPGAVELRLRHVVVSVLADAWRGVGQRLDVHGGPVGADVQVHGTDRVL